MQWTVCTIQRSEGVGLKLITREYYYSPDPAPILKEPLERENKLEPSPPASPPNPCSKQEEEQNQLGRSKVSWRVFFSSLRQKDLELWEYQRQILTPTQETNFTRTCILFLFVLLFFLFIFSPFSFFLVLFVWVHCLVFFTLPFILHFNFSSFTLLIF